MKITDNIRNQVLQEHYEAKREHSEKVMKRIIKIFVPMLYGLFVAILTGYGMLALGAGPGGAFTISFVLGFMMVVGIAHTYKNNEEEEE